MQFNSPKFQAFIHEHEQVIKNEYWYNDGPPQLGKSFSKVKTLKRHLQVIEIIRRAAKREVNAGNDNLKTAFERLADKLADCKQGLRCGSLACPQCARAQSRGGH